MEKKRILFLMACFLMMSSAWGAPISLQHAKTVAGDFMAKRVKNAGNMKLTHQATRHSAATNTDKPAYYVFNTERTNGGFIIVAGDDRVPAVLGYSDHGSFDEGEMPQGLIDMLDAYAAQIATLDEGETLNLSGTPREPIAPMLTAQWSQQAPYNNRIPIAGSSHGMTGATSIAMAEVMHYYKWPEQTTYSIPGYTTSSLSLVLPTLPVGHFNWNLMNDCYMKNDTASVSAQAVAELLLYCAQAQKLDFKSGSTNSTIFTIPRMMSFFFGYQPSAYIISRINYSTNEWEDLIYNELSHQRPVIYGGKKDSFTQVFVCDGCDDQGLFHINWCMNGQYDGYFSLNVLNFDHMGTGSTSWNSGFVTNQYAVMGLEPGSGNDKSFELTAAQLALNSYIPTRSPSTGNFKAYVSGRFYNYTSQVLTGVDSGWGFFEGDSLMRTTTLGAHTKNVEPGAYVEYQNRAMEFGHSITEGVYTIRQIYSAYYANDWHLCPGGDKNYLEVEIRGDSCFITPHGNATDADFTFNGITTDGNMHPNRPVDINVNLTNNGDCVHYMLYMHVNGSKKASGIVSAMQGESTNVNFRYMPTAVGDYVLSFSFNEDGSNPIATETLHITAMPTAKLTAQSTVLNVTDESQKIITNDKFAFELVVTNTASTPYQEDISVALYKMYEPGNPLKQYALNKYVELAAGETDTLLFELDGVVDGWQYYAKSFYYSNGNQVGLNTTPTYTIRFPGELMNSYEVSAVIEPQEGGVCNFEAGVISGVASAGQTVVFSVNANDGYRLKTIYVVSEAGDTIIPTLQNGNYQFTMPESPVTVHVEFIASHAIDIADEIMAGGQVSVAGDLAFMGDNISVTAQPNVGWRLNEVMVTSGEDTVPVNYGVGGTMSFIMPDADVVVSAVFERSIGDRFELVNDLNDITADGIYMIANRQYGRAMKFFESDEDEKTFMGTAAGEWIDENQSILLANEKSCLFSLDNMRIDSLVVSGVNQKFAVADLNTGNGCLIANGEFVVTTPDPRNRRAYLSLDDSACLVRFIEKPSQLASAPTVSYVLEGDEFRYLNAGAAEQVSLYKLVDAHTVNVAATTNGVVTVTSETLDDGTVQRGCEVNFTVEPGEGYIVSDVTVTTTTGDTIEVVLDAENGVYTFVMPGDDVTITATFEVPVPEFIRGDLNNSGSVEMDDLTDLINYLLTGNGEDINLLAANCDQIGDVTMDDLTCLINYLLTGTW